MTRVLNLTVRQNQMLRALTLSSGIVTKYGTVIVGQQTFQPVTAVHLMAKGCIFGAAGRVALTAIGEAVAAE